MNKTCSSAKGYTFIRGRHFIKTWEDGTEVNGLAEQLGVNPSTVSKWCTNSSQPDLGKFLKMADLLGTDIKEFLYKNRII